MEIYIKINNTNLKNILEKLKEIPLSKWNYKHREEGGMVSTILREHVIDIYGEHNRNLRNAYLCLWTKQNLIAIATNDSRLDELYSKQSKKIIKYQNQFGRINLWDIIINQLNVHKLNGENIREKRLLENKENFKEFMGKIK